MPLGRAQELFEYDGLASSLAIRLREGASEKKMRSRIGELAGDGFTVRSRYEMNESMYRIMRMEKWGIFAIGLAVLVIASFSIVGSMIMLIIDKRDATSTLRALGARERMIRGIFVRQGMMIGGTGAAAGLLLGLAVCTVQMVFGVIPMPGATFLVESYPVLVRGIDIAAVCAAFVAVNWIITIFTVRISVK
jgi:lipoprotein-releasing system permease protein